LQALKLRGAQRFDPVDVRCIEAMLRRAAACGSRAQGVVEAKAQQRLQALATRFEQANESMRERVDERADRRAAQPAGERVDGRADERLDGRLDGRAIGGADERGDQRAERQWRAQPPLQRSPLAELLAHIESHESALGPPPTGRRHEASPRAELKTLSYFQGTWAALSAERRLRQSLSALPENAGPLNSQRLLHRALEAMRELSPAYLERFIEHVDTLLWLDDAAGGLPLPGRAVLHVEAEKPAKKRGRRKAV
jgi:hypothetical protein